MSELTSTAREKAVEEEGWSEELQSSHRSISQQDFRFREFARTCPELLERSKFSALDQKRHLLKYAIQAWPTFVGREKLAEFQRVSAGINRLIRQIPARIFRNDPAKFSDFYEIGSSVLAEIVLSEPSGVETVLSRGDFIETRSGFKCIEFNFTPSLGGWETSVLVGMHLEVPATAEFIRSSGIAVKYTNTMQKFFFHVIDEAARKGLCPDGELNIALVVVRENSAYLTHAAAEYLNAEYDLAKQELQGRLRGTLEICQYGALVPSRDALFLNRRKIHAVVELSGEITPPGVYRCFKANKLVLLNGPLSPILSNKQNIALLSEHASSPIFSAEEQELLLKHIPWSRQVTAREVEYLGTRVSLPDLLAHRREDLVLKEVRSYGGKDVIVGRFASAEKWEKQARLALEKGGWIVQEHMESLPYLFQCGAYGCAPHDAIWGPFYLGDTYGGAILRVQPKSAGGPVNLSLAATEGIVLEV
ncbi:MAG: hypothetical protein JF614_01850 [Acidobacteria bacterium]|nr:hypothetical protein [Acidobacteriota bacterium]